MTKPIDCCSRPSGFISYLRQINYLHMLCKSIPRQIHSLLLSPFPTYIHNSHNTGLGKYNFNVASKSTKMSIHTCSAGFKNRERWNLKIAKLDIGNLSSLWKISSLEIDFTCSDVHGTTIAANLWTSRNPTSHPDSSFCTMIQQLNGYS